MDEFNFFFGFFGLLLGLTVAEVATKFADAIDSQKERPIGWLTGLLAVFVIIDIASFWVWTWSMRETVTVRADTVIGALFIALSYFISASLIFPRSSKWVSLDEHYWARKRMVLTGIFFANAAIYAVQLTRRLPQWDDWWFHFWFVIYWGPLAALFFARGRWANLILLGLLIAQYTVWLVFPLPGSDWAAEVGL